MKSKSQQIQFFKKCLIPQYDVDIDRVDFKAHVDSELSTSENWANLKDVYGLDNQVTGELEFMEQKVKHLANRVEKLELQLQRGAGILTERKNQFTPSFTGVYIWYDETWDKVDQISAFRDKPLVFITDDWCDVSNHITVYEIGVDADES